MTAGSSFLIGERRLGDPACGQAVHHYDNLGLIGLHVVPVEAEEYIQLDSRSRARELR